MQDKRYSRSALAVAVSLILAGSLSACGGGGSSAVRPTPTAPTPVPTDPCASNPSAPNCQPAPPTAPVPPPVQPTPPPPPVSAYNGVADNVLVPTHVVEAHAEGFTGKGVKVAVLDSGIDPSLAQLAPLSYTFASFLAGGSTTANDPVGHGSGIASVVAGATTSVFHGGVAPDVTAYIGQICDNSPNGCSPTADSVNGAFNWGARILNLSMGTPSTNGGLGLESTFGANNYYTYAYQPLVDKGALFVWATGNGGYDTTSVDAVAPHYLSALAGGWLAVANVSIGSTGEVTGLYTSTTDPNMTKFNQSAKCGIAADWCLSAPGYVYAPGVAGTEFADGYTVGTSNATAIVSGVAALVSQAYPWMDGHNLQQTVLTTATHLQDVTAADGSVKVSADYVAGTPFTPNATYGWGLVNAERAVHGPGQFNGVFAANIGDANSTFSNPISGSGSLSLNGASGSLALTAGNTYTGGTTINGATLALSGSLASPVTVNGGTLYGDGVVNGSVTNTAGRVVSNSATDHKGLVIAGDYTASAGSITGVVLGHPIAVGGTASLAGSLSLSAPDAYAPQTTEGVLSAQKVSGTFGSTDDAGLTFYTAALTYADTRVDATLTRRATVQATSLSTPVLVNASQGLDNALSLADGWSQTNYADHQSFLDTAATLMSAPTRAMADASVASLSGEIHGTVGAIEAATSGQVDHAVALRQNGMLPGDAASAWVQGFTGNNGLSQTGYASARTVGNGMLVGVDLPVVDDLAVGVVGGKNRSSSTLAALAGQVNERDTLAGVYGKYSFGGSYLAGRASWTHADLRIARSVLIGASLQPVSTTRTDGVGRLTLETGHTFGAITPYVALTALRINQAAFAEDGAGGFGLSAAGHRQSATLGDLGVRWTQAFDWTGGQTNVTGYAAWKHVLNGSALAFNASLVGALGAAFPVAGQSLPRNGWEAGATFDTRINTDWSWFIDLNAQGASSRYHAFGANAGLRYTF